MIEREMGFYWVVEKGHKVAQVAFFLGYGWMVVGTERIYSDNDFSKIEETRIHEPEWSNAL